MTTLGRVLYAQYVGVPIGSVIPVVSYPALAQLKQLFVNWGKLGFSSWPSAFLPSSLPPPLFLPLSLKLPNFSWSCTDRNYVADSRIQGPAFEPELQHLFKLLFPG